MILNRNIMQLVLTLFLLAVQVESAPHQSIATARDVSHNKNLPRRTIAGVKVVDTPIVRAAHEYANQHSSDFVYKHIMRSWLFGALIIEHNETLSQEADLEVHAVASLLHDLGWDQTPGSYLMSHDKRFEVDGAIAAREFLRKNKYGKEWEERRIQLVWDAIALHDQPSIANYKEVEVMLASTGIGADFDGPVLGITNDEYAAVIAKFPSTGMRNGLNDTIIWLCQSKPATTYDTWMQPWGEHYVSNYSVEGKRTFDVAFVNFP